MIALILERRGVNRRLTLDEIASKQAVHHQVRIAANRRSEVRVASKSQSVVADMRCRIASFCHRADSQHSEHIFLWSALDISEKLVETLGNGLSPTLCLEAVSKATDEVC